MGGGYAARILSRLRGEMLARDMSPPKCASTRGSITRRHTAGTIAIPASHQDQVIIQPPNTEVVAASDFTPFASLAWTDRPAISFQFHPEFSPAFAKALIEKRYDDVSNPDAAIASLDAPNDSALVGGWIRNFLNGEAQ